MAKHRGTPKKRKTLVLLANGAEVLRGRETKALRERFAHLHARYVGTYGNVETWAI